MHAKSLIIIGSYTFQLLFIILLRVRRKHAVNDSALFGWQSNNDNIIIVLSNGIQLDLFYRTRVDIKT